MSLRVIRMSGCLDPNEKIENNFDAKTDIAWHVCSPLHIKLHRNHLFIHGWTWAAH